MPREEGDTPQGAETRQERLKKMREVMGPPVWTAPPVPREEGDTPQGAETRQERFKKKT